MGFWDKDGILRALGVLAKEAAEARDDLAQREGADFAFAAERAARNIDALAHRVRCEANSLLCETRALAEAMLRCGG